MIDEKFYCKTEVKPAEGGVTHVVEWAERTMEAAYCEKRAEALTLLGLAFGGMGVLLLLFLPVIAAAIPIGTGLCILVQGQIQRRDWVVRRIEFTPRNETRAPLGLCSLKEGTVREDRCTLASFPPSQITSIEMRPVRGGEPDFFECGVVWVVTESGDSAAVGGRMTSAQALKVARQLTLALYSHLGVAVPAAGMRVPLRVKEGANIYIDGTASDWDRS